MSSISQSSVKSERLEARISLAQKNLFQQAAALCGRSLTDFAISALLESAKRIIKEHHIIELTGEDQKIFIEALHNPPKPNKRLLKAVERYHKNIKD